MGEVIGFLARSGRAASSAASLSSVIMATRAEASSRAAQPVEEGLVGRLPLVWSGARPQLPAEFDGKLGKTRTT
jgi:hypothetical protein